jgi:hypothetical protein
MQTKATQIQEIQRSAFFNALIALAQPSEEDITIAHCYMQVKLIEVPEVTP